MHYRNARVVALRRQEECSVDEGVLVVDGERCLAENAADRSDALRAESRQDKGPGLVRSMRTFVLRSDVVGVPQTPRKRVEDRKIRSMSENVPGGGLTGVG